MKGHHDRFRTPLADEPVRADQQLYLLRPVAGLSAEAMAGLLNSSWAWLCAELAGRVNFGDGVLWLGLQDARSRIGLPDLRGLPSEVLRGLESSFAALPSGPVPSASLLEGDPNWGPARLALDARVGELLGLEEPEVALLRAEALALCQRRLAMAASARGSRSRARRERAETTPP